MRWIMTAAAVAMIGIGVSACGDNGGPTDGEPTGSLTLASTEAAGMYIVIGTTAYTGLASGLGTCDDDSSFTGLGCTQLDSNGTTVASNLCIGDWDFGSIAIYGVGNTSCVGSPIAVCADVVSFTVGPGNNVVNVTCNVEGGSVTFDVSFD